MLLEAKVARIVEREAKRRAVSHVDGQHYSAYASTIERLRSQEDFDEAVALLLRILEAQEAEVMADREWYLAPGFYNHLTAIYEKLGMPSHAQAVRKRYMTMCGLINQRP